jgi:hypothetical protein
MQLLRHRSDSQHHRLHFAGLQHQLPSVEAMPDCCRSTGGLASPHRCSAASSCCSINDRHGMVSLFLVQRRDVVAAPATSSSASAWWPLQQRHHHRIVVKVLEHPSMYVLVVSPLGSSATDDTELASTGIEWSNGGAPCSNYVGRP